MPTFNRATLYLLPVFTATSISGVSTSVFAEETLEPVVVTATRTARTADETLASVSVITRKDIERLQVQSLQEVLQHEVGISVTNSGGAGKSTSTFIRGSESDHVLVLIDGIKVGSATLGSTAFQHLAIDQIERIEIVRGPRSSLYGSEAIGGVIQIFTRKGSKKTTPDFSISAGKYNTKKVTVGVSGGGQQAWYNVSFSGFNTDGFNACAGSLTSACFTIEPDKDSNRSQAGSLRAGYRFDNGLETDFTFTRSQGSTEYDGFTNESNFVEQVMSGSLKFSPTTNWLTTFLIGRSNDESDNFKDGIYNSTYDTTRNTVSWQNDITLNDEDLFTIGVDYLKDKIHAVTFAEFPVTSRDNTGVFAQYQGRLANNDYILAARHDDNQQAGSHTTGSVSWGYSLNKQIRFIASYGTAYKAPTFNELYFPFYGVATLKPESSETFEAGIKGKTSGSRWDLTYYRTEIDDLIDTAGPANVESALINGLEATWKTRFAKWDVNAKLALMDTENKSQDANNGNQLARRPKSIINIDIDRQYGKFSTGMTVHTRSSTYDKSNNVQKIDGYTIVDLRTAYQLDNEWLLQARINNIFNKDYETVAFYNQPKGDFLLTLRYQPKNP